MSVITGELIFSTGLFIVLFSLIYYKWDKKAPQPIQYVDKDTWGFQLCFFFPQFTNFLQRTARAMVKHSFFSRKCVEQMGAFYFFSPIRLQWWLQLPHLFPQFKEGIWQTVLCWSLIWYSTFHGRALGYFYPMNPRAPWGPLALACYASHMSEQNPMVRRLSLIVVHVCGKAWPGNLRTAETESDFKEGLKTSLF